MFDKIIQFSIRNKLAIGVGTLLLVIWGVFSLARLPIDAVPDITNNQVQVITQAPTLGAQEVEQYITAPIELALANIPEVTEKRSISRSGISVITIVFRDNANIYWARQQVNERLQEAETNIPKELGQISLAPVTTGLGEIYQYVIHTKKGYEDKYTAMDLRTIQDWVVRTQLAGTEGLAEVSGWGGYVKQYEIAVDNEKLNAQNITIPEIYAALEKNNGNTGGSYIEQRNNTYFIRGLGQVKTLGDIEKIVVKNVNGIPTLIRDIASVRFGSANRYGAVTRNGEGEVVAGVALMLKGENFSKVIANVKQRMIQIQKSLPEGVVIEPFIDRTELVGRAISTVKRNLLEGAAIVILVLVLLLGNLRAGLLVASVIPLSMLFAFGMMRSFGVSGNLMSLGAIDFGLIVDGAVIIVEAIIFRLTESHLFPKVPRLTQPQMDAEVYGAASRIRNSAAFGEIIILIVYLPLFALVGIEGKMFRPMAETVAFAILGAFILSLTYVPMMSALVLSRKTAHRRTISDGITAFLQRIYEPALTTALRYKVVVVSMALALFLVSLIVFQRLGGEFIPTLDEGDLTVEIAMMQGTSLSQVVATFGKAEKILKERFPEVKQVVTRIGSAEIPTDPMPLERGDMMVAMLPREKWTSAHSREEMIEKMEKALSAIPGINREITQPMQMRFNELMTGIRQDVAIKIYGEDLDILAQQANKVARLMTKVKGVSEPFIEKVSGLPQITVSYNRDKMAQYGLNISDVNTILRTAFAGNVAGVVFEGEKRFDLVVRLQRDLRENIVNIGNLYIPLHSGNRVPLNQVADIEFKDAPAQISREDGRRRIYVGFNVRGRDVESTVLEIQQLLDKELKLPAGYYTTYGGQFENLKEAKQRLAIALPSALLLILILLYVTFRSFKQTLLIFTAVPLSAIGGVFALLIRGMPFSISAGVGFIALFGVAVLNGLVLIGYFNQLKQEGLTDIYRRVLKGTEVRLRPVIMTAAVASLGFLPMALSASAGAEVQRPLATVVIGGLITATLLTLFVLPCLYILFSGKEKQSAMKINPIAVVVLLVAGLSFGGGTPVKAQARPEGLQKYIDLALKNNLQLRSAELEIGQSRALQRSSFDPGKTNIRLTQDPTSGGNIDNSIGVTQSFAMPGFYRDQKNVLRQQTSLREKAKTITEAEIIKEVRIAWYNYLYGLQKLQVLDFLDSLYSDFSKKATVRQSTGETSNLERLTAQNKYQEILLKKKEAMADMKVYEIAMQQLINSTEPLTIRGELAPLTFREQADTAALQGGPVVDYHRQAVQMAGARAQLEKAKMWPEITLGYNHQLVIGGFDPAKINRGYFPGTRIAGFEVGLSLPLFAGAYKARINGEKIGVSIAAAQLATARQQLNTAWNKAFQEYGKFRQTVEYYRSSGLALGEEQMRVAQFAFSKGEIGYIEYVQNITMAVDGKLNYLAAVNEYNTAVINLEYLRGNK
ncbi:CusA/CzcA family heavy metal efflux RND transporter [Flavitalea sp. BT771]|uniref:CusA/CzcA family heavy metal efflux RND transporter n=1 Tax=Flavitalea sp. BT771 TaxID=3063329 RepID=UPI0026E241A8|nr:CusA/CzcA family heavy metal efflux RND transporter [Flavitalea sp. BT771]MDO6430376.1 CusA/CzcA family heavy metal efflux RND transporter [Flavitalea sp. BT771]MDV6219484.1 CusA/CzcA family heavy metal efflux RND transporter [Flavitalea sp. BT771]